jgi:hypothetical protein
MIIEKKLAKKLVRNRVQCKSCMAIIESKHRHDFQQCPCGETYVDGGLDYCRVGFGNKGYKDMSEYKEISNRKRESSVGSQSKKKN